MEPWSRTGWTSRPAEVDSILTWFKQAFSEVIKAKR